ncbi:hypothetical protein E4T56_gene336 [Termitomyces sp. T112]|nr:hypothetical protein E4T56_gene336 [Termitomyces sp. T112]
MTKESNKKSEANGWSGMEWAELVVVDKECWQLYEKYKGEDWIREFDKHFAPLLPLLEFLLEDMETGMILFEDLSPNDQFFFQHPPCKLAMMTGVEYSKGHESDCAAGSITKELAMLPRVAITPKGKGKGKTREEDKEKEFVEPIQDTFTVKKLGTLVRYTTATGQ